MFFQDLNPQYYGYQVLYQHFDLIHIFALINAVVYNYDSEFLTCDDYIPFRPVGHQADIGFFSASDRGSSENFGLKTRIYKFSD